ncbi:MAG: cyclohexanecarboxylate-CoA ligase [Parvibaculum sp.]|uniref:cyclohexanecarboxylate-CoA ligase n=1 Tax=Parvibaculum sp. TaxID=2024848 RepID=UPI002727995F|nr:cyclohexanecarboxylate-CoA ligase [Parvibaculum sp.]MDO8839489.1 cyclohexanecarboxylate-CoA ligase [Parvibaculum sp.]
MFNPILPDERVKAMNIGRFWPGKLITDYLDRCIAEVPDKTAVADFNSTTNKETRLNYRDFGKIVDRIAIGLAELGVEKGDVVSCQLPNWWQFTALYLACVRIGAVINPLMPIFRERELSFMLGLAESKVLVIPRAFRGCDYPAMVTNIRADLPWLKHVLVIGGDGETSFEKVLLDTPWEQRRDAGRLFAARRPDPDDVTQLMYTSGTTGEPKGVMHTSNTLLSNILICAECLGLGRDDVMFMASPMAHQTGFMYGLVMPILVGATAILQDVWELKRASASIAREGITFTMASTPFLSDLTETVAADGSDVSRLRIFLVAGAPIPRALVERARQILGTNIVSAWGMTENGLVTTTRLDDPDDKAINTDGRALPGMEVQVVDSDNRPLPAGEEGMLKARACSTFVGYLKRPDWYNHDAEGWFDTGDLARIDGEGYIRLTGRSKDVIIRGGENIPVVEIEGLLFRHPDIQDVAIVGVPDERLGERACAFIVPKPGREVGLREVVAFLEEHRMARQYLPERAEIVGELPRTPSGKVQKFKLREIAVALPA